MIKKLLLGTSLCMAALGGSAQEQKAYIVSNAHFDSQWNWDVKKSIIDYIPKTIERNLMLLRKYPNYVFNFEGGVKYAWMKEFYPYEYELVKQYIKEGRWHVTGSTWDATDTNIPAPESLTRNILYGQHYFRDEFGVESTDIFLPDCFGFGWTLPTIAAHSGLIGFSTQKLMWRHKPFHGKSKIPFEYGLWQGVDGSKIMIVADARNYTTKWKDEDLSHNEELKQLTANNPMHTTYHYYGTGDTGGSPTITSVRAVEKGLAGDGPVKIISATSDQLYKDYLPFENHPELPLYNGELLMDVHGTGCYTSQAAMKLYNRRNELVADAAERAAVMADWAGAVAYPHTVLTEAWKRFVWHQFHDDLTGTSLPKAYEYSWNDELISLKQFANVLHTSVGGMVRGLDTRVKGTPVVVYNPASFAVSQVAEVLLPLSSLTPAEAKAYRKGQISAYNARGEEVKCQFVAATDEAVRCLVEAEVPTLGYAVYELKARAPRKVIGPTASATAIENSIYKVTLNAHGDIQSIVDKRNNQELVAPGKAIRLAFFKENRSEHWPAWEIMKSEIDKAPVSITDNVKVSVACQGPLRAAVCVERTYGKSTFKQYICLSEGAQADRIDLVNDIDWQDTGLLKAEFPLNIANPEATYDLGVGAIRRGNNTETAYEVYGQYWADLTNPAGTYGVSMLNDSKYGWDKPADNTLRLTLLHTPQTGTNYDYQDKQDMGRHHFTYSIVGHAGDLVQGQTVRKAEQLNQPLTAFVAPRHKGAWGRTFSFAQVDNEHVLLKALKKAEKGAANEYVVRFYETSGKASQDVNFTLAADIAAAVEVNGVEDKIADASFDGRNLRFSMKPYSMKSFKITLKQPAATLAATATEPLALPFNKQAASYNAFRQDVNFDGKGNSFAAELWPEALTYNGIDFRLASPDTDNAMKCNAQTVKFAKGKFNRIYVLAASTGADCLATFRVGKSEQQVVVPSYAGFVGQWGHTGHTEGYLKPADVAFVGTHMHNVITNKDLPYDFTYMYCIPLDVPADAESIEFPDDRQVVVFAATAAFDENHLTVPAADLLKVNLEAKEVTAATVSQKNLLYGKTAFEKSGEVNHGERAECAVDEEPDTKWCDIGLQKAKYIAFDLGKVQPVNGWQVFHASLESLDYTTKEYCLQVKVNETDEWTTVDSVTDNVQLETNRLLQKPVEARYVRLYITKPDQSEGRVARIYEFSVY